VIQAGSWMKVLAEKNKEIAILAEHHIDIVEMSD
jgi:hypothetical protein